MHLINNCVAKVTASWGKLKLEIMLLTPDTGQKACLYHRVTELDLSMTWKDKQDLGDVR